MAIENLFLEKLARSFSLELPEAETMDEYLDMILPEIRAHGEDLREEEFYLDTRWLEIREDDDFHEAILHIFREEEEYLLSVDGNISRGVWRKLPKSNTIIIDRMENDAVVKSELFDLAFMNADFFILKKHGDQTRIGRGKYFVMGREKHVNGLEWRDVMESIYNIRRNNSQYTGMMVIVVIIVAIMLVLSLV